jgi:uncharacterized protein (TIGR00255 family)
MIFSMTGYGKAEATIHGQKLVVEIRTLNSKQPDINMRIPQFLRDKEMELRTLLRDNLIRGKIDVSIMPEPADGNEGPVFNKALARHYYLQLKSFAQETGIEESGDYLALISRLPDVFSAEEIVPGPSDWNNVEKAVKEAIAAVIRFRSHEGSVLENDFKKRINRILSLLSETDAFEKQRIDRVKERIVKSLNEHLTDVHYDKNRLEQELIYYLEKFDVTEEKVRLKKHCEYFLEVMRSEQTVGKKLAFVLQEIGREINTLGSKANDADMQKIVVLMKDELEKMKEQMLNIL